MGVVWAVLALGLVGGCGSDGGGGAKPDADDEEEDGGKGGGPRPDGGIDGGGEDDADVICVPKGCDEVGEELGYELECGTPDDGCGEPLDCGECTEDYATCGGGGEDYKCGCTPKTCDDALVCGTAGDGCGGEIACGDTCDGPDSCGGGGTANECGCAPKLDACGNAQCGTAPDGCGGTVECGDHAGGCSEARTCGATSKQCACKPQATLCEGKCGLQNIDGCPATCPACAGVCGAGEACSNCTCPGDGAVCNNEACCTPDPLTTTCGTAVCGTKVNNCGQTVTCGTGTCAAGSECTAAGQCVDPKTAALVGKYAVRNVSFATAVGIVTRSESLGLVDISVNSSGKLEMREQGCWTAAYKKGGSGEERITKIDPGYSANVFPVVSELDLTQAQTLPGPKEWVRGKAPPRFNAIGWRRGRPLYCPLRASPTDQPAANPAHEAFAPPSDPHSIGAKKPWLAGATCLCPEQEVEKRGLCPGMSGAAKAACIDTWAQDTLPYAPGEPSADLDVSDCRVVDEEIDGKPGMTVETTVNLLGVNKATIRSASIVSNIFWGKIDLSGAKQHWGVSEDQPEVRNSAVACVDTMGGLAFTLCDTSSGNLCPPYPASASKDTRINPVDFAPLDSKPTPSTGWTCQAIYDNKASLFGPEPTWSSRYPTAASCE